MISMKCGMCNQDAKIIWRREVPVEDLINEVCETCYKQLNYNERGAIWVAREVQFIVKELRERENSNDKLLCERVMEVLKRHTDKDTLHKVMVDLQRYVIEAERSECPWLKN